MPGHRLSRLAKGTPLESRLSIGTIALGVNLFPRLCAGQSKGILKREKNVVLDLAPVLHPRYKISEFTIAAPVLTSTPKSRRSVVFRVRYKYYRKNMRSRLAWYRPRADCDLSRPTSVQNFIQIG